MQSSSGIGALGKLSLNAQFPPRPGHGTQGKKIAVYANFFRVQIDTNLNLMRYNVEVSPEAKGKKLKRVFELLLESPEFSGVVTEFKSMLVARNPLNIPDGYTVTIPYRAEGEDEPLERAVTYTVRVVASASLLVSDLVRNLSSTSAGPPMVQKLEIIQALNALLNYSPLKRDDVASFPASRHFSVDPRSGNVFDLGGGLKAIRGFVQSVRPVTGGLALNVNAIHGVVLNDIALAQLYPLMGSGNKVTLQKKLKMIRVRVTHLPVKKSKKTNEEFPRIKTIFGLAHPQNGRNDAHPPQVASFGAGPRDVKFWLSAIPSAAAAVGSKPDAKSSKKPSGPALPTNAYISVFDYFRSSKFRLRTRAILC